MSEEDQFRKDLHERISETVTAHGRGILTGWHLTIETRDDVGGAWLVSYGGNGWGDELAPWTALGFLAMATDAESCAWEGVVEDDDDY